MNTRSICPNCKGFHWLVSLSYDEGGTPCPICNPYGKLPVSKPQTRVSELSVGTKFLYRGKEYTKTGMYCAENENEELVQFHRESEIDAEGSWDKLLPQRVPMYVSKEERETFTEQVYRWSCNFKSSDSQIADGLIEFLLKRGWTPPSAERH